MFLWYYEVFYIRLFYMWYQNLNFYNKYQKYLFCYRCVATCSATICKGDRISFPPDGGIRRNRADVRNDTQTFFFCRRIPEEHLLLSNGGSSTLKNHIDNDKMVVISDVYEYFVSDPAPKVELHVPIPNTSTRFDDISLVTCSGKKLPVAYRVSYLFRTLIGTLSPSLNFTYTTILPARHS